MEKQYYILVCVCVRACVRACGRVSVWLDARVAFIIQHEIPLWHHHIFLHYLTNETIFWKGLHIVKYVF